MKKLSLHLVLKLLFVPFILAIPLLGWERWSATVPQPLPRQSTVSSATEPLVPRYYYQVSVPLLRQEQSFAADYQLWIPEGVEKVRGILVKQHGCGDATAATGLDHAHDLQWQVLATKHQLALLGTKLPSGEPLCDELAFRGNGSETAFLRALSELAQKSNHPELEKVPWAIWGHSGGADWGMQMLLHHPDRTVAVVAMRSGGILDANHRSVVLTSKLSAEVLAVPVLFALGEKDPYQEEALELPKQVFSHYRLKDAPWSIAVEAKAGHEAADTRFLAIPYLDAIFSMRLNPGGSQLRSIDRSQGWLANPATKEIAPTSQYRGDALKAAWLPNEETARKWQQYVTTGKISPTQKSAAPIGVTAKRLGQDILVTWKFVPDLENGLPSFRIYRDHWLIKTLQGQTHNFGDAPLSPNVVLEFQDKGVRGNPTYQVGAFNDLGETLSDPQPVHGK